MLRNSRFPVTPLTESVGMVIVFGGCDVTQKSDAPSVKSEVTKTTATAPAAWHIKVLVERKQLHRIHNQNMQHIKQYHY